MTPPKLLVFEWWDIVSMRYSLVFVSALCLCEMFSMSSYSKPSYCVMKKLLPLQARSKCAAHLIWTFGFLIFRHHLSLRVQTIPHQWWLSCIISWQIIISRTKNSPRPLNFTCTTFVFVQTGQYFWILLHILHSSHFFQYWKADNWFQEWKKNQTTKTPTCNPLSQVHCIIKVISKATQKRKQTPKCRIKYLIAFKLKPKMKGGGKLNWNKE